MFHLKFNGFDANNSSASAVRTGETAVGDGNSMET